MVDSKWIFGFYQVNCNPKAKQKSHKLQYLQMTWKKDIKSICFWNELVFIYNLVCISLNLYLKNSESLWKRLIFFDAKIFCKKYTDGKSLEKSAVCTDISSKNRSASWDVQIFSFAILVLIFDFYFKNGWLRAAELLEKGD